MLRFYTIPNCFRTILAGILLMMISGYADAQVKIGTNGAIIAPSSLLELESTNQGLLLPRLPDTVAINSLNPPNGMLIYLTKTPAVGLYVRKVTGWEYLTGSLGGNGNFNSLTVSGSITAGNFSGPLTGNATSATIATTATNSVNSAVTNDVTTTTITYPTFVTNTPGNMPLRTSSTNLSYIPSTGVLTALGFRGPLVGNVTGTATLAIDATNAANTAITNDITTNAAQYVTFVSGTTGNLPQKTSSTNLTFNPSTGNLTAIGFTGNLTGNATTATSSVTATNAVNSAVTNDITTTGITYPVFVTATPGNLPLRTSNTNLSYVPSTGALTALRFNGPLTGNVTGIATQAIDATNSANVGITNDVTTNATMYPTFVSGVTGNLPQRTSNTNLSFNPNTGILTATGFSGNLSGNSTTATNATTTTINDDLTTAIPTYPTFVSGNTGNLGQRTASTRLSFIPSTGALTTASYVSTVPTGTPPLVVASSSIVANLSATNTVNTAITDDVATAVATYPTFVLGTTGNLPQRTSSSRLTFIPSTGALTAASFVSTVATGTAPFTVASTTTVPNLSIGGSAGSSPANTLTGTVLAPGVVTSSLTQVGIVNLGTWNAGSVSTPQLRGRSILPAIAAGASAGVGSSISISGTDVAGQVTIVVNNAGPAGAGTVAIVTYNTSFPNASYPVLYPANAATAQIGFTNQIHATGTGVGASFTIFIGTGSLTPGVYSWNYHVIGN